MDREIADKDIVHAAQMKASPLEPESLPMPRIVLFEPHADIPIGWASVDRWHVGGQADPQ